MRKIAFFLTVYSAALCVWAVEPTIEFKLDEGKGSVVKDVSGKLFGKILHMGNTGWQAGRSDDGKALYFTGAPVQSRKGGCAVLDLQGKIDFSKPFTMMYYFYVDKKLPRTSHSELVSCCSGERGPGFRSMFSWNRICFWIGNGKNRTELNTHPTKVNLRRDVWHHLTITCANGKVVMYLNGVMVMKSEKMLPIPAGKYPVMVGSYSRGYAYNFKGAISDIKFFDRALSDKEVLEIVKGIK